MIFFWHRFFGRFLLLIFIGLGPASAPAAIFSTIVTNGPTTNRVNLVFLSEGYTSGQMVNFLNDATNAANAFLTAEPYAEYATYFNVFAIFTNSANTGSTHLNNGPYVLNHTYFNSTYNLGSDDLITIPPNSSDPTANNGQGKIDSLLQTYLPFTNNDLAVLLVNDGTAAGAAVGGTSVYGKLAISSIGSLNNIMIHETGHTLGNLGDEYSIPSYPDYPTNNVEPNTTTQTNFSQIKWNAWIDGSTPIPTPVSGYDTSVGLFEGAHYNTSGWYRPFLNCRMQSSKYTLFFCPVCQEALVLAIYGKVRPLTARFPTNNSLTVTSATNLAFSVNLLSPATHSLNVQWRTNNVAMAGATNTVLSLSPMQLGGGTKKVEAVIWDATDMVRTDLKNVLKQTNTWTLTVTLPVLVINSLKWLTNGNFTLQVTGTVPDQVSIQMSTNLSQWVAVQTNVLSAGKFSYTNIGANQYPQRFFRALTPP